MSNVEKAWHVNVAQKKFHLINIVGGKSNLKPEKAAVKASTITLIVESCTYRHTGLDHHSVVITEMFTAAELCVAVFEE